MNVKMYNCYFGDCFRIGHDKGNPLYVDFGISGKCSANREAVYRLIEEEMQLDKKRDFILTHYHEDHFSGVIHAGGKGIKFENVFIPDIWNLKQSVKIVKLHLMIDWIGKSLIKDKLTLLDFLESICGSKVYFIGAGDSINNKYTVLWPERDCINALHISKEFAKIIKSFEENYRFQLDRINEISENLVRIMREHARKETADFFVDKKNEVSKLKMDFDELKSDEILCDEKDYIKLSRWENEVSVVFHSKKTVKMNMLFCGDVPKKYWTKIVNRIDLDKKKIRKKYRVIKVPHHGTADYYKDFSLFSNENTYYLIPNARVENWKICAKYPYDILNIGCNVVCAGNNCENNLCCIAGYAKRKVLQRGGEVCTIDM